MIVTIREEIVWYLRAVADRGLLGSTVEEVVDYLVTNGIRDMIVERHLEKCDSEMALARKASSNDTCLVLAQLLVATD